MRNVLGRLFRFEHRRHPRFPIREGDLIVFDSTAGRKEEIIDLSMGGLAFSYIDERGRLQGTFTVDFRSDSRYCLGKTRVQAVSDVVIAELVTRAASIRRIGVRFMSLTPVQEFDLAKFLRTQQGLIGP